MVHDMNIQSHPIIDIHDWGSLEEKIYCFPLVWYYLKFDESFIVYEYVGTSTNRKNF